jgi:hypothetical protein
MFYCGFSNFMAKCGVLTVLLPWIAFPAIKHLLRYAAGARVARPRGLRGALPGILPVVLGDGRGGIAAKAFAAFLVGSRAGEARGLSTGSLFAGFVPCAWWTVRNSPSILLIVPASDASEWLLAEGSGSNINAFLCVIIVASSYAL